MEVSEELWRQVRETVGSGRLSVILPVYSLADAIAGNLLSTAALFRSHGVRTELVPVDDGSGDGTADEIARAGNELAARHDDTVTLRPVYLAQNGGKGAALRAGFEASCGDYVLLLDGDLDIHPGETPKFFEQMVRTGADVVVGSKRHPESEVQYPWHRRFVSWVYFTLVRLFVGVRVTDTQTGMKLFRRPVLGEALGRMLVKTYAFDLELLAIAVSRGAKVAEAPVVIRFGQKFGCLRPRTVWEMARDSLAVFYRLKVLRYYAHAEVPRPLATRPFVSVVIACPRPSWMLKECIEGLERQTWTNWECIVLPDDSEGEHPGEPRVRYLPTGKVRPAEKRNLGIAAAKGEIIAFIDDDAYPDVHWLEYAVKYFSEPSIGAVGGPGVTPPGDGLLARAGGRVYSCPLVSGNYRYRYEPGGIRRDVDDYPSCNLMVRKALLDSFGGYRTDFWPGEDTLLCKDIVDRGVRIVYDPWVVVYHHRRALFAPHLRQLSRYAFHRGYFCKRYPSNSLHLGYFIPSLFVLGLAMTPLLGVAAAQTAGTAATVFHGLHVAAGAICALYAALVLVTTFTWRVPLWILTVLGVFLSHLAYGIWFVRGLCARRAPCEFIGKDHA